MGTQWVWEDDVGEVACEENGCGVEGAVGNEYGDE